MVRNLPTPGSEVPGTRDNPLMQEGFGGAPVGARDVPGSVDMNRFWNDNSVAPYSPPGVEDNRVLEARFPKSGKSLADTAYRVARQMAKQQGAEAEAKADAHFADGGTPTAPFFERNELYQLEHADNKAPTFLAGSGPGRTDTRPSSIPSGSYVLPADVISGLGSGNSGHGADVMNKILSTGPYGSPLPRVGKAQPGLPRAPRAYEPPAIQNPLSAVSRVAAGGRPDEHPGEPVQVMVADGEMLLYPHHVKMVGGGDIDRGHRILDAFVLAVRKKNIQTLKKLPGPKRANEK